ncbi:MAG: YdjY domain-containing protein [Phycisphaerae bacterium]
MLRIAALLMVAHALTSVAPAQLPPASQPRTAATAPSAQEFAPGVKIDWLAPAVRVAGHVVLREGSLEFLACFAGKEHESIIRLDAGGKDIYLALGLIGVSPGAPPRWDEQRQAFDPPRGDLVDISLEWLEDGRRRAAAANNWLRSAEYATPVIERPWVFSGSRRVESDALICDQSGEGVALVDFPNSLLSLSRGYTSHDTDLWAIANSAAIPPEDTQVTVVLHPARTREIDARLDRRGALLIDGTPAGVDDLVDLLRMMSRIDPARVQPIRVESPLRADEQALRSALTRAGIAETLLRIERTNPH